jgi:hypothetical protein
MPVNVCIEGVIKIKSAVRYLIENSTKSLCQRHDSDKFLGFAPFLLVLR